MSEEVLVRMIPRLNFSCWGLNCTSTYLNTAPMCQQELVLTLSPSQTVIRGLVKVLLQSRCTDLCQHIRRS